VTSNHKAKTAARERAAREQIPYVQTRVVEDAITRLMIERGLDRAAAADLDDHVRDVMARCDGEFDTYEEALAWLTDPANEVMCDRCGWTWGMVCPECAKGCGCETSCAGWRHHDWGINDDEDDGYDHEPCPECGAGGSSPYDECQCA
jgi:hypothetical protein